MKLTEREKWLMQQAWNVAKDLMPSDYFDIDHWCNAGTGCNGVDVEMLLAHSAPKPESIVKKVDADNLPEGEVLIINEAGTLSNTELFNHHGNVLGFLTGDVEITHYIEQKDLIEWITGAGE